MTRTKKKQKRCKGVNEEQDKKIGTSNCMPKFGVGEKI